ncbi:MAG: hypothetical protein ACI4K9_04505 [Candidatus Fimenecus sp.]
MCKRLFPLILLLAVLLGGCGVKSADNPTNPSTDEAITAVQIENSASTTVPNTASETKPTAALAAATTAAPETSAAFTMPEKKGEMFFSDDPENKFIQAIVKKYGSDPARLACIYAVPEADNNHVFEFDGTTDASGKLVRNADTLKYVYSLNADCSTITRAAGFTGNDGLSAAQGYAIFEMTKKLVLPEFEEELNA